MTKNLARNQKRNEAVGATKRKRHRAGHNGAACGLMALFLMCILLATVTSCARMGNPDGGWYDDTPPRVVGATPADRATSVKNQKVTIHFNEFIKLEDAQSKVIVSPPQIEQAEIRATGKRILVELKDTLKENTTYTIDFSDAITDNNEGNPMGNYTYSFSTGSVIDTLAVSGYCLNAADLEPIKGILVGLYKLPEEPADSLSPASAADSLALSAEARSKGTTGVLSDTVFRTTPFMRVSRTNGSGFFTIKGVAPGKYNVYAVEDADGDFKFSQKSERIGYSHDVVVPSFRQDVRQDTVWIDSLHIDNIIKVPYTRFLPDDFTLLCFQEPQTDRYLLKTERKDPEKVEVFFTYGSDSLPVIRGLDFDESDAFVVEASQHRDTLCYWLRDTTLINRDTLTFEMQYYATDTLGQLVLNTDTIEAVPKQSYEKRQKQAKKDYEKWEKEQEKLRKKGERYDSIMPRKPLEMKVAPTGQLDPTQSIFIDVDVPLEKCDTSAIHLYCMIDSVWYRAPHQFTQEWTRTYRIMAEWQQGLEYSLEIDSAAFVSIYGEASNPFKKGIKVRTNDEFSTLVVNLSGLPAMPDSAQLVVELLESGDKPARKAVMGADHAAEFFFVKPNAYYLRAFVDMNGNGVWDTGLYDTDRQAEPVFYHTEKVECKEKWDVTRSWNLTATPRYKQKPAAITKQKPDKEKQLRNRNIERARSMGKEYVKEQGL